MMKTASADGLPRALAALTGARAPVDATVDALAAAFVPAVARLAEADAAYRVAIERLLPPDKARAVRTATDAFRLDVAALRERTRAATGYGDFDPLDTYVPPVGGSHAHAVRAANTADLARSDVAAMRERVNARIGALLERSEIERLIEAKRARNAAFDRAIRAVMPPGTSDALATHLALLADGWF